MCVIGGGIAGCSTALHLAERGYRVRSWNRIVSVGEHPAVAADKRSSATHVGRTNSRQVGRDDARRMWDISVEGLRCSANGRAARDRLRSALGSARRDQGAAASELLTEQQELEDDTAIGSCDSSNTPRWNRSSRRIDMCGAVRRGSGHLHPLNYTLGLAAAAQAAGVRIFEDSEVTGSHIADPAIVRNRARPSQSPVRRAVLQRLR